MRRHHLSRRARACAIVAGSAALSMTGTKIAHAVPVTLGQQDFADGQFVASVAAFNGASVGEPVPFDQFYGSDFGASFSQPFTFNFPAGAATAATISFGIWDHDSLAPGNQVASFTLDGFDLTAPLNSAFESHGGDQAEVNVYTVTVPAAALPLLADGQAVFSLTLQGPGLQSGGTTTSGNGAGLDFATLDVTTVPEPAGALAAATILAAIAARRRT